MSLLQGEQGPLDSNGHDIRAPRISRRSFVTKLEAEESSVDIDEDSGLPLGQRYSPTESEISVEQDRICGHIKIITHNSGITDGLGHIGWVGAQRYLPQLDR